MVRISRFLRLVLVAGLVFGCVGERLLLPLLMTSVSGAKEDNPYHTHVSDCYLRPRQNSKTFCMICLAEEIAASDALYLVLLLASADKIANVARLRVYIARHIDLD